MSTPNIEELKFLVVDDNTDARTTVIDYLKSYGCKSVASCNDGYSALSYCTTHDVDFIISDWEMPGMDGLDLLKEIRTNPKLSHIPFVMITSPIDNEELKVIDAAVHKVNTYVIKPFGEAVLLEKIREALLEQENKKKKLAIVADDDPTVRSLVVDILTDMGFHPILQTARAFEAYQLLTQHHDQVAIVISDWEMPEMTGIEFLHKVRTNSKIAETPFIIITSQTSIERLKIKQAVEASVDHYLVKPFTIDTFQQKVNTVLSRVKIHAISRLQLDTAKEALVKGDLIEAEKHFQHVKTIDPKNIDALMGLAAVEMSRRPTKGVNEAVNYLQEAVTINPKSLEASIELALAYEQAIAPEKATHCLRDIMKHHPSEERVYFQLGRLLVKRGKFDEALEQLQKTIEINPNHHEAKELIDTVMKTAKPIYKKK